MKRVQPLSRPVRRSFFEALDGMETALTESRAAASEPPVETAPNAPTCQQESNTPGWKVLSEPLRSESLEAATAGSEIAADQSGENAPQFNVITEELDFEGYLRNIPRKSSA
jgi:hypothetical protein